MYKGLMILHVRYVISIVTVVTLTVVIASYNMTH